MKKAVVIWLLKTFIKVLDALQERLLTSSLNELDRREDRDSRKAKRASSQGRARGRLLQAPGWRLRHFADLCFSKKTYTQVLEPALSDMQKEHFEALAAHRPWKARMVLVRGYWSFWSAVVAQLPISFARRVYEIWKTTKPGS